MPYRIFIYLILAFLSCCFAACQEEAARTESTESNAEPQISASPDTLYTGKSYGLPPASYLIDTVRLPSGVALENFLRTHGVHNEALKGLAFRIDSLFSVKKFRAGRPTYYYRLSDSVLGYWIYSHTPSRYLLVDFTTSPPAIRIDSLPEQRSLVATHVTIKSSLWNAMHDAGASTELALRLSDLFAWTVDFFALAEKDEFFAVYEKRWIDGQEIGIGEILTAYYVHANDTLKGYRFWQDSAFSYWDEKGNSLRRAFLKAPLSFTRISSKFSYARLHPILKVVRAHTGVDYAAPMGTPVMALGDGVILNKGYDKGGGNFLKIRHNAVYTTGYLHLSGYAKDMQVGRRVRQGEVIGYVGMTGYATGPHLDFRVWKNGQPVNPLTLDSPSDKPIADSLRRDYERERHLQDSTLLVLLSIVKG